MLVEFTRARTREPFGYSEEGEDLPPMAALPEQLKIKINPLHVAAVLDGSDENTTIIRLADGRGFKVRGNYNSVCSALEQLVAGENFHE